MSSNGLEVNGLTLPPVKTLVYLDMSIGAVPADSAAGLRSERIEEQEAGRRRAEVEFSHNEFAQRIQLERAEAVLQTEQRMRGEFEQILQVDHGSLAAAISEFTAQREQYFARAEAEIVQLSLAIAAKILHREAQVDPMLLATLVRLAIEKMRDGSSVTIRVGIGEVSRWKQLFAGQAEDGKLQVIGDGQLSDHDCMVETELGVANFGLDAQLKEVEQGFFDLMALRPVKG